MKKFNEIYGYDDGPALQNLNNPEEGEVMESEGGEQLIEEFDEVRSLTDQLTQEDKNLEK